MDKVKNSVSNDWNTFEKIDFELFGRKCVIVKPPKAAVGCPFVFRCEFFGAFPAVDIALCGMGYHIVYIDVSDRYGSDGAITLQHDFHMWLCTNMGLSEKAVLFGFSRGGLYAVNYAAKYPQNVSCLYLDAPVLNILSWPGGKGSGCGSPECYEQALREYGISDAQALSYRGNPIDKAEMIAEHGIPVISVVGCVDKVVPYDENMKIFEKRFSDAGGNIRVIEKTDCDHHPHSLDDPTPVCDFILKYGR